MSVTEQWDFQPGKLRIGSHITGGDVYGVVQVKLSILIYKVGSKVFCRKRKISLTTESIAFYFLGKQRYIL